MNRRGFIAGVGALLVAPSIVRAGTIMPVKVAPAVNRFVVQGIGSFEPLTTSVTPEWIAEHVVSIADRALFEFMRCVESEMKHGTPGGYFVGDIIMMDR